MQKVNFVQKNAGNNACERIYSSLIRTLNVFNKKTRLAGYKNLLALFKQERFKNNFILMNQNSDRQQQIVLRKIFFKLLNNSNFGKDCRNNDNCIFQPICDELEELSYLKKY